MGGGEQGIEVEGAGACLGWWGEPGVGLGGQRGGSSRATHKNNRFLQLCCTPHAGVTSRRGHSFSLPPGQRLRARPAAGAWKRAQRVHAGWNAP